LATGLSPSIEVCWSRQSLLQASTKNNDKIAKIIQVTVLLEKAPSSHQIGMGNENSSPEQGKKQSRRRKIEEIL